MTIGSTFSAMRQASLVGAVALGVVLLPQAASAFGRGGFGGGFHAGGFGGAPLNFHPHFNAPPGPRPPGPGPGPGPGPRPPGPPPHPPGPPGPPPYPYHPGYLPPPYYPGVWAGAAAVGAALAVGTVIATLPPACETVIVNGYAYQRCGNTWYQPQYQGHSTVYVVVAPPR